MRIGIISGEYPPMPGGIGAHCRVLAGRLAAEGHDLRILSRRGTVSETLPLATIDGWGPGSLPAMRRWTAENRLEIVNLHYQTAAFDMAPWIHFAPSILGAPLATTFHDLRAPYLFPKAGRMRPWIVQRLARSSAGIITTNAEDDAALRFHQRCKLIPIGSSVARAQLSPDERKSLRATAGANDKTLLIGHFGFIKPVKGVDLLVEAVACLRGAGHDLRLAFIGGSSNTVDRGKDAGYLRRLRERINASQLAEATHWTSHLPEAEVGRWLAAADLVALPFRDGASARRSSLIAAIHSGCAILSTTPSPTVDAFEHGRNLWLVAPGSAEAIAAAIDRLASDREQLRLLREGAAALGKRFAWDEIARQTLAFFETCL